MLPKYAQNDGQLVIRGTAYENKLIESLFIYLSALKELNIDNGGIVQISGLSISIAYFGNIRTLFPVTSGQHFGIIRTA